VARGVVATGGIAIGLVSCGGLSLGILGALGGVAVGLMSYGGLALGLLASGGLAVGFLATGGVPIGWYAMGGTPISPNPIGSGGGSGAATAMFQRFTWFFGSSPLSTMVQPLVCILGLWFSGAAIAGLLAVFGSMKHRETDHEDTDRPAAGS
jgi:hypothetical protein